MGVNAKRRGATLAELCVAIAIVAITAVMAVSFSFVIKERVESSRAKMNAQEDIALIESVLQGWMSKMAECGAEFTNSSDAEMITATIGEKEYLLSFSDGIFNGQLPDGENMSVNTLQVRSVAFSLLARENQADTLLFCTVTCDIPRASSDQSDTLTRTFCSNPHVADVIKEG